MLATLKGYAELGSLSRDTQYHDYHDNWNDLSEVTGLLQSALGTYLGEHAPPATPDGGDAVGDDVSASEKELKGLVETFVATLKDVIDSGE